MRWISVQHENDMGTKWKQEGWYFDNPTEDYQKRLRCKKCRCITKINQCEKDVVRGYRGDSCCAPVFYLRCPTCFMVLAAINEGTNSPYMPMLYLDSYDGKLEVENG